MIIHAEHVFTSFPQSDSLGVLSFRLLVEVSESRRCPCSLTGWWWRWWRRGISVASVSPEDCVEVKQLSVAEGHQAGAESGEVRLTGSYYVVHCPQTEVPASSVTLQFLICLTDLFVSRNL